MRVGAVGEAGSEHRRTIPTRFGYAALMDGLWTNPTTTLKVCCKLSQIQSNLAAYHVRAPGQCLPSLLGLIDDSTLAKRPKSADSDTHGTRERVLALTKVRVSPFQRQSDPRAPSDDSSSLSSACRRPLPLRPTASLRLPATLPPLEWQPARSLIFSTRPSWLVA
jgi:hypothetical protein